jgi:hypothetical protein
VHRALIGGTAENGDDLQRIYAYVVLCGALLTHHVRGVPFVFSTDVLQQIRVHLIWPAGSKRKADASSTRHENGIIDKRLHEWGDELRKHRNLAAHASGVKFNLIDAKDLYDFSTAICEYVFVLTEKFDSFKERQAKQEAKHEQ